MTKTAGPPPAGPRFYVPSNRVGARLLLVLPLVGGGLGALLGLLYAFASGLIVEVFEERVLFIIVTPMFGGALALAGRAVCYLGQVRRAALRLPISLVVGLFGYYFSWQAYLKLGAASDGAVRWTMGPLALVHAMIQLADSEGTALALAWLLEAATVFGMIVWLVKSDDDPPPPFCEKCGNWTGETLQFELADSAATSASEHLQRGDAALAKLPRRKAGELTYTLVRVNRCGCGASRFVSVHHARLEKGKDARIVTHKVGRGSHLDLNTGSPDETHYTPVLVDLVITEEVERALIATRDAIRGA